MSRRVWTATVCALLIFTVMLPAAAQDSNPIAIGETAVGEITAVEEVIAYTFEGTAGEIVGIDLISTSDTLDPYLELLDDAGEIVAANDDSAGTRNARLGPINLPADGTYTIQVSSCCPENRYSVGTYALTLKDVEVTILTVDEPVSIDISAADPEQYLEVDGAAVDDGNYLIIAETDDTISYFMDVYNPDGSYNTGDNAFEGETFIVEPLRFDEDEIYPIDLIFEEADGEGTVTITLESVATDPIESGTAIEDTLSEDEPSHFYTFNGDPMEQYRVTAEQTGDAAFEVLVYDAEGNLLLSDSTRDGAINLFPVEVTTMGEYLVVVQRIISEGDVAGEVAYNLLLEAASVPALVPGEAVTASLTQDIPVQIYGYEGSTGEALTITLASADDSFGVGLDVISDATGNRVVALASPLPGEFSYTVSLPDDGFYTFYVFNGEFVAGTGSGSFSLTVASAEQE